MEKTLILKTLPETNLIGDVRVSSEGKVTAMETADFLIELEDLMTKYKVVKIACSFDVFKMQKANKTD